jgi:iron complex outermembrane receptor protein
VEGAAVETGGSAAVTGVEGTVRLRLVPGAHELRVTRIGFAPATRTVEILAGRDTVIRIELAEAAVEEDAIVVVSTRGERRIEDEPLRVEVVTGEEIEEKLLMPPGSIAVLLNETAGLRVQETSPTLGGASIRVQGLRGRYTQLLADGLPLYGGQSGALSLLQIPPMDLAQVEVIKGAASALYGSTALGGVVNLISKRAAGPEREALINLTTNGGTDALLWLADSIGGRWSYTLLGGAHAQNRIDADGDGWSDVPRAAQRRRPRERHRSPPLARHRPARPRLLRPFAGGRRPAVRPARLGLAHGPRSRLR